MTENKTSSDTKWEVRRHSLLMRGLMIIIMGLWFALISIAYILQSRTGMNFGIPIGIGFIGLGFIALLLQPLLFRRYYARRTGYVKLPGDTISLRHKYSWLVFLIALILGFSFNFILISHKPLSLDIGEIILISLGIVVGIGTMYWGYHTNLREMFYFGCCFLIGFPLLFEYYHAATFVPVFSILFIIYGLLIHRRYLKWWHAVKRFQEEKQDVTGR